MLALCVGILLKSWLLWAVMLMLFAGWFIEDKILNENEHS